MCAVEKLIFGAVFVVQIITFSNGKPLFVSHPFITSLLGASSGSASSPDFQDNPLSENIGIVLPKPQKLEQNTSDNSFSFPSETTPFDITTSSEAPTLLQKKIDKILRKIVTVSQIKQALSGRLQDNSGFQYPYTPDLDEKDIRISKEYGTPLRIDLKTVKKGDIEERKDNNLEEKKDEKVSPGTFGVFLLEVFASLIGLSFGAAAQINHSFAAQNNTL